MSAYAYFVTIETIMKILPPRICAGAVKSTVFFAFTAGGTALTAASATAAFSLYLAVNQPTRNRNHGNGYDYYDRYVDRIHIKLSF